MADAAILQLYTKYGELIYRWANRILREESASEDVVQDVAVTLLRNGDSLAALRDEAQRRSWLYTTTYRQCLAKIRKRSRENLRDELFFAESPTECSTGFEERSLLESLMERLDKEERVIAILHFEEGRSKMWIHTTIGRGRPYIDRKLTRIRTIMSEIESGVAT